MEREHNPLENKLENSEVKQAIDLTKNLEIKSSHSPGKILTREQYVEVIRHIELLKELEDKEKVRKIRQQLDQEFPETDVAYRQGIPVSAVYKYAKDFDIPHEYVQKALETRVLSEEDKFLNSLILRH